MNKKTFFTRNCALILISFLHINAFSQTRTLTAAALRDLRIHPAQNQVFYVNSDIKFEVEIPYTKPSSVDITMPSYQENVNFKSLRKTESPSDGTKIELWFSFEKAGEYELEPLQIKTARLGNTIRKIQFEKISLRLNPKDMNPVLVIQFENGPHITSEMTSPSRPIMSAKTGQPLLFKVFIQYSTQLIQFKWDIPKDSIFTRTKEYEITEIKFRDKHYSDDLIPVSDFNWIPLATGKIPLPEFALTVTGYDGTKQNLRLQPCVIQVEKSEAKTADVNPSIFDDAFDFSAYNEKASSLKNISPETSALIAALRTQEKKSAFYSAQKQRKKLEDSLGLPSNQNEFKIWYVYLSLISIVIFAAALIFALKKKKFALATVLSVLLLLSLSAQVYSSVMASKKYAISKGCALKAIPEKNAAVKAEISGGNRIRIKESAEDWVYVEFGAIEGWTEAEGIIPIGTKK